MILDFFHYILKWFSSPQEFDNCSAVSIEETKPSVIKINVSNSLQRTCGLYYGLRDPDPGQKTNSLWKTISF